MRKTRERQATLAELLEHWGTNCQLEGLTLVAVLIKYLEILPLVFSEKLNSNITSIVIFRFLKADFRFPRLIFIKLVHLSEYNNISMFIKRSKLI
jgi:hypothetical protein